MKVQPLPLETTFAGLQQIAHEASGVPLSSIRLLAGFPPNVLALEPEVVVAGTLSTGDTVIIEGAAPAPAPVSQVEAAAIVSGSGNSTQPKRKRPRKGGGLFKSEGGIAEQMVAAGSGKAQDEDLGVSYLRDALKIALSHVHSETLANFRFKAALSGNFTFEPVQSFRLGGGGTGQFNVKFKGERAWKEDLNIEIIDQEALRSVYELVLAEGGDAAREHLKPFKMAQISPRCFWSLVYHFEGDVQRGLQTLLPDHDWSFLSSRAKNLSEKAQQNQAQAAQAEALKQDRQREREKRKRKKEEAASQS
eukprot:TRINITY_DN28085_c0_g1_i2.p1 TRINITY_DN28085_c0_g1~~TRINITY_DN28085_c0_g1_i2.p1  ORF type:complete len:306 (+),score=40.71 TRINITY_DN28085_c0_g1_i2:3-920(+)